MIGEAELWAIYWLGWIINRLPHTPIPQLQTQLTSRPARRPPASPQRLAKAVQRAETIWRKMGKNPTCLHRSLTLIALLHRHAMQGELIIGVQRPDTQPLQAHAWVEYQGQPLLDSAETIAPFHKLS